jgi:hypothetical protein
MKPDKPKRRKSGPKRNRAAEYRAIPEAKPIDSGAWEQDAPTLAALSIGAKKPALTNAICHGCDRWVSGQDEATHQHWREHRNVMLADNPKFQKLAALLVGYSTINRDGVFFVSVNKAARVLGVSKDCSSKWIWLMRLAGYLEMVAETEHGKARRYRFTDAVNVTGNGSETIPF